MPRALEPLPIDSSIDAVVAAVRSPARAVVLSAAPGAGKTTRVPPALVRDGPVLLLQPRRVAARAIARRIADEQGWTLGREVGWHVRFDRRYDDNTKLIVATEGILTARVQQDPLLAAFRTVVLDEFHERSVHADLGLAFAREAWRARDDLRIVVMSATMDAARVARYLGDCPVIEVPGRLHPIDVSYHPGATLPEAVAALRSSTRGAILCFLPGAAEIRRAGEDIAAARSLSGFDVVSLHGGLDADAQDAAIRASGRARVVLATNIAETTITVPDVTAVVDGGYHRAARYDAERGIDSLRTERISQDSADQRAGRAGRLGPGIAWRLWDARDRLARHREPEIARVDLSSVILDVLAWGGHPRSFAWFEPPPEGAIASALELLRRLDVIDEVGRLTPSGRDVRRMPLHPRLARMLIEARGAELMARACAVLSEPRVVPPRRAATVCDLLSAVEEPRGLPPRVMRVAEQLTAAARAVLGSAATAAISERDFRRAVFAGYRDRLAKRRATGSDRFVLGSGTGARLARESGVVNAEYVVATDISASAGVPGGGPPRMQEAIIRLATSIDEGWIEPTAEQYEHFLDTSGRVRAVRRLLHGALILREVAEAVDPDEAASIIAREWLRRGPGERDEQLLRRARFAGMELSLEALAPRAARGAGSIDDVDLEAALSAEERRALSSGAPATLRLPGVPGAGGSRGTREVRLDYRADGAVVASIRLQHVFGLAESPRLGRARVPVTFELLAPNGRPVQVTQDLASFWRRGYADVRKELRGRYPKHAWPEDPYNQGR